MLSSISSNWYAIQLVPGANRPIKEYWIQRGPKGGRSLKSVAGQSTLIERGCRQIGVELYVPMETNMAIHHRSKKPLAKALPMLAGFAFVRDVRSFPDLEEADGVSAILGMDGSPYAVPQTEIDALREVEAGQVIDTHRKIAHWHRERELKLERKNLTRKRLGKQYPAGTQIVVTKGHMAGRTAAVSAVTGRRTIKAMMEMLGQLTPVELPFEHIETVA